MRRDVFIYGATVLLSVVGHYSLLEGLGNAARKAPPEKQRVLEFAVVAPPPPAPVEPPPPPPEKPKPKPVDLTKVPKMETPPPPNTTEEPTPTTEPPKPVFGISMSSTVGPGTSGFSVRVGNTLMKDPDNEKFTPPSEVKKLAAVPLYQVNKQPTRKGDCMGPYPEEAKRMGIEGKVKLEVEVLADGTVGDVRLVSGLGHGLDEVAMGALRKCRFEPAEVGGQSVVTRIPYTYTFVIQE